MAVSLPLPQRLAQADQVRVLYLTQMVAALDELGSAVHLRLTARMNETATSREMHQRRDAWQLYQTAQAIWRNGIEQAWRTQCADVRQPLAGAPLPMAQGAWTLVDTTEVDNQILASRLVLGLMEQLGPAFDPLRLRIRWLEARDELPAQDILRPEVLAMALVVQWQHCGMPREAWSDVSHCVQQWLGGHLQAAYAACNQHLIAQGVLPTIDFKDRVRRAPVMPAASVPSDAPPALDVGARPTDLAPLPRSAAWFGGRLDWRDDTPAEVNPLLGSQSPSTRAELRRQVQGLAGQVQALLGSPGAPESGGAPPLSPALTVALAPGGMPSGPEPTAVLDPSSPVQMRRWADALQAHSRELKKVAGTRSEKATIEIVALMFQAILTEERIPPAMRIWFARLQMPVLRVALAEPAFFGTLDHPARQLIDRMGSCVMGFDAGDVGPQVLEAEIKRIVQVIEQYPETGRQAFEVVYAEFEQFLRRVLTAPVATRQVVSVAQQVEQKEILTIQYTIELRKLLQEVPVREHIRDFLYKVWAEVLAVATVRHGAQDAQTVTLRKTAADLVWMAGAKPQRSERSHVMQALPHLLQRLRAGMDLLGLDAAVQAAHVQTVSDTLAEAFLAKTAPIAPAQIALLTQRLAALACSAADDLGIDDLPLDAESVAVLLGLEACTLEVLTQGELSPSSAMRDWARALQVGDGFRLAHNGCLARVQLVWRSERQQLNLLVATDGRSYLMQEGRLAAYLQAGLLVPQEREPLTVRLTRDALHKIAAHPERLLD